MEIRIESTAEISSCSNESWKGNLVTIPDDSKHCSVINSVNTADVDRHLDMTDIIVVNDLKCEIGKEGTSINEYQDTGNFVNSPNTCSTSGTACRIYDLNMFIDLCSTEDHVKECETNIQCNFNQSPSTAQKEIVTNFNEETSELKIGKRNFANEAAELKNFEKMKKCTDEIAPISSNLELVEESELHTVTVCQHSMIEKPSYDIAVNISTVCPKPKRKRKPVIQTEYSIKKLTRLETKLLQSNEMFKDYILNKPVVVLEDILKQNLACSSVPSKTSLAVANGILKSFPAGNKRKLRRSKRGSQIRR